MKINYGRHFIDNKDISSVIKVLKSDFITQGNLTNNFENKIKYFFGSKYCCAVSNGTSALYLVGKALGWGKKDIIITSPITFVATANCIVYNNATPLLVDIDPISYNINLNNLETLIKKLKRNNKKISAVIGVDFAGNPCNWKDLRYLADKYNFILVNDNCHALGAKINKNVKYAAKYADIVTHSYHAVKNITTGEGGAILTNNRLVDKKIRTLKTHGIVKNINNLKLWQYDMKELGYNFRMTDFQCALGISQLDKMKKFLNYRNNIAKKYNDSLKNIEVLTIPKVEKNVSHAYHLYPLKIDFKKTKISKINFFLKAKKLGINFQVHYIPIYLHSFYKKNYNFKAKYFPNSQDFYDQEVSLPIYYGLKEKEQKYVIKYILKIIE